ncbi:RNA polymerase sigma-70 factor (ECF subfamily) [Arcticibacter tournemirensis]|uniref:RNA polymerase sigma-70 factor n=1 Tax=Arcticibacter tournemirensis TaxID=699437 RepID=A0A5M9HGI5_9SPHI|nr:RNA polymerase sigma-70 factor [Arcticibacter tournemirensis]KAA8484418.1 RNA polymerase sigma-70 factor [Arcticibacter tournemirensis]TQM49862.1 RNA polymerase sigma-70 factor (ECF subfamily) [Arcticibacter tournemirensis]
MYSADIGWSDEKLLLAKIAAKDEKAFRWLYDMYRKKIYSYALKVLKFEDRAEDVVHEVFLSIWQHEHPESIDNIESYIHVMARNSSLRLLRRQQLEIRANRELALEWKETHEETEQLIITNETGRLLQKAIEYLPPQQRTVFRLCREEGLKYKEVAERLSISQLTVKTHMQQALRSLRMSLQKHNDLAVVFVLLNVFFKR